jgi:site-specific DNA-methyltransferase (cytosine-N4-specific)
VQAGVAVTPSAELTALQTQFLATADLNGIAPIEAWTVTGSNQQMGYSTHGIFRYFGKFPPPIAAQLISLYTRPGDLVVDPMCGSGTTGVEAALADRQCVLSDVNPMSVLLSQVKTTRLELDETVPAVERVVALASTGDLSEFRPVGLRNPDHWFLPQTTESLGRIRDAVHGEPEGPVRNFLLISFASIVRRVSRATTQQGRLFLDVETAVADALPVFERAALKSAAAIATFRSAHDINVLERDLTEVVDGCTPPAPLSIVHPPYFNMYKYSSVNSLEMAWLGMDVRAVRKREVREFFKVGRPENVDRYLADMTQGLGNACHQVAPGGVAAVMVGDTTIGGEHIQVTRPLLDSLPHDIAVEKVIVRVPKFTEATWAASQRRKGGALGVRLYDLIVILRKAA